MVNFSYKQEIYDEIKEHGRRYLNWTNKEKIWSYEDCSVTVLGIKQGVHIVIRRERTGKSKFKSSEFKLQLMMGFSASDVKIKNTNSIHELEFTVIQSKDKHHRDLQDVIIFSNNKKEIKDIHKDIQDKLFKQDSKNIIFPYHQDTNSKIIPVIYQPRIDAWENFLREINIHKEKNSYKITLAFQGERLRKFILIDPFYKFYRLLRFKRTIDIETFEIRGEQFYFEDIYSGDDTLFDDSTHNQKEIDIKYYFSENNHPVIFVNTANHALAPHDNNHDFWKWEYIPWVKDTPLKLGEKTRKETEESYKRF